MPCFLSITDPLLLKIMNNKLRYERKRRQLQKAQSVISGHYQTKITLRKFEEASLHKQLRGRLHGASLKTFLMTNIEKVGKRF